MKTPPVIAVCDVDWTKRPAGDTVIITFPNYWPVRFGGISLTFRAVSRLQLLFCEALNVGVILS